MPSLALAAGGPLSDLKMTTQEITKLINSTWVQQIRAGEKHRFVEVSIVALEERFFVRRYKFGNKSWHAAFMKNPKGTMRVKPFLIPIEARVPKDLAVINSKLNWAFHKKFPLIYFFMRLTFNTKRHEASTLELIPTKQRSV